MPLIKSRSKKAFESNLKTELKAGKPKDQSLAISYSIQRKAPKKKASGGTVKSGSRDMNYAKGGHVDDSTGVHTPNYNEGKGKKGISEAGEAYRISKTNPNMSNPTKEGLRKASIQEHRNKLEEMRSMPKPKLAEGGQVNAKSEKRPMPNDRNNDRRNVSENSNKKELYDSQWDDQPTLKQARSPGLKGTKIKHPKMVKSDVLQVRMRDEEDDLQDSAGTNEGPQRQPPQHDDEVDATKRGKSPEKQTSIATGKKVMAEGGKVTASDYDHTDPNADTDSDMHLTPSEDEGESNADTRNEEHQEQTSGDPDKSKPHSANLNSYAQGGQVDEPDSSDQPEPEQEEEHHDSIASAIMANRDRMHAEIDSGSRDLDEAVRMASGGTVESGSEDMNYADGGMVDIDDNNNEEPNAYPPMNGEALDHNMNDAFSDMEQPEDSNMIDDDREDERSDRHDMIDSIRRKMKSKWKLSET